MEHHLSTIKIEKKSLPINLLTEKGRIWKKVSSWGQNISKTLLQNWNLLESTSKVLTPRPF